MRQRFFDKFHIPAFGWKKYLNVIFIPIVMLACLTAGIFIGKAIHGKNEISFYGEIIQKLEDQNHEVIQFIVEGTLENGINHKGKYFLSEPKRKGAIRDINGKAISFSDLKVGYCVLITYNSDQLILAISPSIIEGGVKSIRVVDEEYGKNRPPELVLRMAPEDGSHFAMTVKEGSATGSGLTLVMENKTDRQAMYGQPFEIDQKVGDEWIELIPTIENYAFTMEAFIIPAGQSREMEVHWEWLYGQLSAGRYRIVKNMSLETTDGAGYESTLTAEFEIPSEALGNEYFRHIKYTHDLIS